MAVSAPELVNYFFKSMNFPDHYSTLLLFYNTNVEVFLKYTTFYLEKLCCPDLKEDGKHKICRCSWLKGPKNSEAPQKRKKFC